MNYKEKKLKEFEKLVRSFVPDGDASLIANLSVYGGEFIGNTIDQTQAQAQAETKREMEIKNYESLIGQQIGYKKLIKDLVAKKNKDCSRYLERQKKELAEKIELFERDMKTRLHNEPFEIVKSGLEDIKQLLK